MFISNAYAQAAAAPAGAGMEQIFLIVAMVAGFYFFIIRPQKKKANEHKALMDSLGTGDEVITAAGILGKIVKSGEGDFITVEIADNVEVRLQKGAIAKVLPKGTIKSL